MVSRCQYSPSPSVTEWPMTPLTMSHAYFVVLQGLRLFCFLASRCTGCFLGLTDRHHHTHSCSTWDGQGASIETKFILLTLLIIHQESTRMSRPRRRNSRSRSGSTLTVLILITLRITQAASPGLAWPNQLYVPMAGFTAPNTAISSYYTWSPSPVIKPKSYPSTFDVPFDFIPMIWGCSEADISGFNQALKGDFGGVNLTSTKDILGFNEPDLGAQANCSPERAAKVWIEVLEPLKKQGYRLGSPAVTGGPEGKKWMQDWFAACNGGCDPDFVAVHWVSSYGSHED